MRISWNSEKIQKALRRLVADFAEKNGDNYVSPDEEQNINRDQAINIDPHHRQQSGRDDLSTIYNRKRYQ